MLCQSGNYLKSVVSENTSCIVNAKRSQWVIICVGEMLVWLSFSSIWFWCLLPVLPRVGLVGSFEAGEWANKVEIWDKLWEQPLPGHNWNWQGWAGSDNWCFFGKAVSTGWNRIKRQWLLECCSILVFIQRWRAIYRLYRLSVEFRHRIPSRFGLFSSKPGTLIYLPGKGKWRKSWKSFMKENCG